MSAIRALRLLLVALLIAASPARAAGDDTTRQTLDSARSTIADIETALKADNLSDSDLVRLRAAGDPLAAQLQAVIVDLSPRLEASAKRLAELTPKSKEPAVSRFGELRARRREAEARRARRRPALGEGDAAADRRHRRAHRRGAARPVRPRDLRAVVERAEPAVVDRSGARGAGRRERAGGAVRRLAATACPPASACRRGSAFSRRCWRSSRSRRRSTGSPVASSPAIPTPASPTASAARSAPHGRRRCSPPRRWSRSASSPTRSTSSTFPTRARKGALDAVLDGLRLLAIANALAHGLLAPGRANWRLVNLSDRSAALIERLWLGVAAILAVERLLEPAVDALGSLNIAVAGRAVGATLAALFLAATLRRLAAGAGETARPAWAAARAAFAWALAGLTIGATLTGYVAFATYVVQQTMELTMIVATLYIVDAVLQEGAEALLKPGAPVGRGLTAAIGLRRDALDQIVVLVQGFARLTILVGGTMIVLGRWSVSQDFTSSLRAAYFGFKIGGVTLSVSSLLVAGAALAIGMAATRALQNWLSSRYLPRTRLDAGVSNSIRTIVGYIGVLAALAVSGAQLGLDFQKLAIVAGALSVGIGFGLQSIANNFVSGLILLWERGIRVGDWVVVGAEQGFVRRINARATEIETFDRGTLIVPNATLVGGPVKNWMHADRTGRIVVAVNVAYESDVETAREILIAAAKAQDSVLAIPAPLVLFNQFGDWALKFELICYVDDIVMAERVRSEMNFDILRRMREAGLRIPYPK